MFLQDGMLKEVLMASGSDIIHLIKKDGILKIKYENIMYMQMDKVFLELLHPKQL